MTAHKNFDGSGSALRRAQGAGVLSRLAKLGARKWCGWVQLLALLFLFLEPLPRLSAVWVPDSAGNPYWLPATGDYMSSSSPDYSDNGSGEPVWYRQFQDAGDAGVISWWGGGNWLIDGQSVTFPAQYHSTSSGDSDGDGIPDDLDPYPNDPNNNTVYWPGGTFMIDNVPQTFAGFYAPANSNMLLDSDGDGIPDVVDPYPNDPNNGNPVISGGGGGGGGTFWWGGGSFMVDGAVVNFPAGIYSGSAADSDGDGIPDGADPYPMDPNNNNAWWSGGNFMIDGNLVTLAGQWHRANAGDADSDGIPDDLDPYPNDPTNNSYWWTGGWFTISGNSTYFPAQYMAGNGQDSDGDGIPDAVDPYPADPNNNNNNGNGGGNGNWWPGGTFLINGQYSTYAGQWYSGSSADSDGDGIPDALDPYPNDPWNNTYFTWAGGTFLIDGQPVFFPGGTYGGLWADADGDGIPDVADPYPNDPNNNTAWWQGGTFVVDGNWVSYAAQNHRANAGDADGDGIPDDLDPYPSDPNNNSFWWNGGSFQIDNSTVFFPAQYYAGNSTDTDGDGIPDVLDPYPNDPNNGNSTAPTFWWAGGTFTIDGAPYTFSAQWYAGTWADSDGDGIPDALDPYPNDPNNNSGGSGQFYWGGGTFLINNVLTSFAAQMYPGTWADSDGDGIPDSLDPYPNDASNGNTNWWPGGTFTVDGQSTFIAGQSYSGPLVDSDGDGIPDFADPYPSDPNNNTAWWPGGTFLINGQSTPVPGAWHRANAGDADGDGIPDDLDPYPNDPWNGTYFIWPSQPASFVINGQTTVFNPTTYAGLYVDTDGDGIPDVADPYPNDANNGNSSGGGNPKPDSDGDGISDAVELQYGLNPHDPSDAQIVRADGLTNLQAYQAGLPLNVAPMDPTLDSDGDGMPDIYEIRNGLDPRNPADAADSALRDFIFNVEKAQYGLPITAVVSDADYLTITGHSRGGLTDLPWQSEAENDWDGDGISNIDELLVFHTDPRDPNSQPTRDQILQALSEGKLSMTTKTNLFRLVGCRCGQNGCLGLNCPTAQAGNACGCQSGSGSGGGPGGTGGTTPCTCQFTFPPIGGCTCASAGACNNDCVYQCQCGAAGCNCTAGSNCGGNGSCVPCACPTVGSGCACANKTGCDGNGSCATAAYNCPCGGNLCHSNGQCTATSNCQNNPQLGRCFQPQCVCSGSGQACGICLYQDACLANDGNGNCQVQDGPPPVSIDVEDGMAGVVGDTIPSAKASSTAKHFVSPKLTDQIPAPNVILKATGVSPEDFDKYYYWDYDTTANDPAGGPQSDNHLHYLVGRGAPRHVIVQIKSKDSGNVAATMHVWIVWADATPQRLSQPNFGQTQLSTGPGAYYGVGPDQGLNWKFIFTILPAEIITDPEHPALEGNQDKTHDVPGAGKPHPLIPGAPADEAVKKWDLSRQMHYVSTTPTEKITVNFPGNDVEGNDDPGGEMFTEEDNPYRPFPGPPYEHDIGQLVSTDGPWFSVLNGAYAAGTTASRDADFREFARVQLWDGQRTSGQFWFRISDYTDWHHSLRAIFKRAWWQLWGSPRWHNNGSSDNLNHILDSP